MSEQGYDPRVEAKRAVVGPDRPPSAWDDAHTATAHLQETVDELANRLEPVLSPFQPRAEVSLDVAPAERSPLGVHVETLRLIRERLDGLILRLDL